jgi:hypothetical protein
LPLSVTLSRTICQSMSKQGGRCVDLLHAISGADGTKNAYASGLVNRDDCYLPEREGRATDRRATREDGLKPLRQDQRKRKDCM